jgi:hypothetical protein
MHTLIGRLVQVAKGNGLYMFAIDTQGEDGGMLMLPMTIEEYYELFPAGEPPLHAEYEIQFEQINGTIHVRSMFNLASEVIPADLVPTLVATQEMESMGTKFMDKQKHDAALEERLQAIRNDESLMNEIQEALAAEQAKREENIKKRQSGTGIEALFTDEEVANFRQPNPEPFTDFSATAQVSRRTELDNYGEGTE